MDNLFEQAARLKLRFNYRGTLTVEDLYDLSEHDLDRMYRSLTAVKNAEGKGLIEPSSVNTENTLREQLVKRVFDTKRADAADSRARVARAQRNQRIMEIIQEKKDGALADKSISELTALLEE